MPKREQTQIAVIGRACRLPGAKSIDELWSLLSEGRCAVTEIPSNRWSRERFYHPRGNERGRSYTWAAGVLDDILGFDPAVFGISPREAEAMDPQQRLLLELTWEALEDAGIRPSQIAGSETGVYAGAGSLDYGNMRVGDFAAGDAYFATGNTLSIISNRISYIFDLRGPSFTVDTACSSSLVALNEAVLAIESGRVDTAIVAGVNILASPYGFISFSQASMLSRTGLCQAFSAKADGYVRAEGGGVIILRRLDAAQRADNHVHGLIAGSDVNSDGRTTGISLPSRANQAALLDRLYSRSAIHPDDLAFVEAHGTGTRVGDPAEAGAIGDILGIKRSQPLPVGSIKTNIGHTETAAGIAGVLKAMLALEHDLLPASLHFDEPNPDIPFANLNLQVADEAIPLKRRNGTRFAGVSSFGFGGTNAHVILADAPKTAAKSTIGEPGYLMLSAHTKAALAALADSYAKRLEGADAETVKRVAAAAGHRRERLAERLVIPLIDADTVRTSLRNAAEQAENVGIGVRGTGDGRNASVAFVFSGNGSQWPGMGRSAYEANAIFRKRFDEIDAHFQKLSGWSLVAEMFADDLADRLSKTSIAQPLIFAIQSATNFALEARGLTADVVLGHSVGEVAAAEAAGKFDIATAVRVIYFRSLHQERAHEAGSMAVVFGSREAAEAIAAEIPGIAVAAHNSPRGFTVSGPASALKLLPNVARAHGARTRKLDLAYPFHSKLMDPVEAPLLADLDGIVPKEGERTFVSTVTGDLLGETALDANYWWRNVRDPVLFMEGLQQALQSGARIFVEIGPSATLLAHINDVAESKNIPVASFTVLDRKDSPGEPITRAVATALANGAQIDEELAFGRTAERIELPFYPWQRKPFSLPETIESFRLTVPCPWHPLIGGHAGPERPEWRAQIDPQLVPDLADHKIDGTVLLPGSAFVEMALAVARSWLGTDEATITELDIQQPMPFLGDMSREVMCRVSPETRIMEILSRPRLGHSPWQAHATAKIVTSTDHSDRRVAVPRDFVRQISGSDLYLAATAAGLQFGPSFQNVARASKSRDNHILVDLREGTWSAYGLDPARLDSCFHGLILLFADLSLQARPAAYLPVRFGEVRLWKPGTPIARAIIEVVRCNERTIIANISLIDSTGGAIAHLRQARFQAVRARGAAHEDQRPLIQRLALATQPTAAAEDPLPSPAELLRASGASQNIAKTRQTAPADLLLLEGWATSVAFKMARKFAENGRINIGRLVTSGRLPAVAQLWFADILSALEDSGLARQSGEEWSLKADANLPDPDTILASYAEDHPERAAELLLAARTATQIDNFASGNHAPLAAGFSAASQESYEFAGGSPVASAEAIGAFLRQSREIWPGDRALRILQIGYGPLSTTAASISSDFGARLTLWEPDRRRLERARLALEKVDAIEFADALAPIPARSFDLVLAADSLGRVGGERGFWASLGEKLTVNGLLLAAEPSVSLFRDLVFGLNPAWFDPSLDSTSSVAAQTPESWQRMLDSAGLIDASVHKLAADRGGGLLLLARRREEPMAAVSATGAVLIVTDTARQTSALARELAERLTSAGCEPMLATWNDIPQPETSSAPSHIIHLAGSFTDRASPMQNLADRCEMLERCVHSLGAHKANLWVIGPGALRDEQGSDGEAATGLWSFSRSLANEIQTLKVRRVDINRDLPIDTMADRLCALILSGTDETEIVIEAHGTRVLRVDNFDARSHGAAAPAARLERGEGSGFDRLSWAPARRPAPASGEVEIEIEATGLNFRDVMWGLGLLPEEILEDGFAGATLGLECAGRVLRVGSGVTEFQAGDRVLAFARSAFATHVCVPAAVVARIPEGVPTETAATIPVAFLTAYYGLITCARLRRGEWVLIHGGAGGVGLAALQIARWRGARVIATAGSPEKRDLVHALGAEHVLDSRSGAFVDEVLRITKDQGVSVVLNSLSGEAMERSISVLKPFGRFVELGKRDYVANTHIGLRPFRRNLSYFGVDLDQLILNDSAQGRRLFRSVMRLFEEGSLSPLPYRKFKAGEIVDAFRLMQQAGHIGKIVIAPPGKGEIKQGLDRSFVAPSDKTILITGGLGGFGLETARWLVDRGARHLVLVGRSGASNEGAQQALKEMRTRGVNVRATACDVSDESALRRLLRESADMPRLGGVIHAAMVLDDFVLANFSKERLEPVLQPKVKGADNLDRLTRDQALEFFILYSSATTLVGNPGQSAYVAANGYMEGLARRRRKEGLPGLAIGWGAIEDVGILTRMDNVRESLSNRVGVTPIKARAALDKMGEILAGPSSALEDGVVFIAPMNWGKARDFLPSLRSPTFAGLARGQDAAEASERGVIDVRGIIAAEGRDAARRRVCDVIVEELARILRLPQEDVPRAKPLAEIGLDSLMGVELAISIEERFALQGSLTASATGLTISELGDQIIGMSEDAEIAAATAVQGVAERHFGKDADWELLGSIKEQMEAQQREA
ncbi:MAG: phthiocerol/phenolphthiocerol synthesis type-I polyketide synthase [Methylobacteriaceae bacterium]|nr:phthiocerol/phenolphthiocerol synthesis type-I polyketide synthase [Methylobacteriaceae bacterium]